MKFRILLLTLLVGALAWAAAAQTAPEPAKSFPTITQFMPCGPGAQQLSVFSEGTAWNRGMKAAWLTVYNPTHQMQTVWLRVFVDGYPDMPITRWVDLTPHSRYAWHINDELLTLNGASALNGTPSKKDFNFASEVLFQTVGVANLAVWELGSVGFPAYLRAAYLKGTDLCVTTAN